MCTVRKSHAHQNFQCQLVIYIADFIYTVHIHLFALRPPSSLTQYTAHTVQYLRSTVNTVIHRYVVYRYLLSDPKFHLHSLLKKRHKILV